MKTVALVLFIAMYVGMIAFTRYRPYIALGTAVLFVVLGIAPLGGVPGSIDWNVLMMLCGTMGTVSLFIASKMPNRMADKLLKVTPNVMWAAVAMSLFSGIVSAFIDNVATVLMLAPIGLAIAKKLKISPVPLLICISVSSNLQGAATLVGDTTSIMLGGYAGMDFTSFFFMDGKPSIFWAVELGALATVPVIMTIFHKDRNHRIEAGPETAVEDFFPSILLVANVLLLILASFVPDKPGMTNGIICLTLFVIGLVRTLVFRHDREQCRSTLGEIDYETLLLLASLFVVIGGITHEGIIDDIAAMIVSVGGQSLFVMYTVIVFASVLLSAFIDNIPYVATMLPVVQGIASMMGCSPILLYFGLLCGATLGGNLTPVGASANIVTIGILRKNGYEVSNKDFIKIGVPFTLVAVLCGYLFCWFVWA